MQVAITFMDVVALIAMLIAAAWGLLTLNAWQFNKSLDTRFAHQDEKLKHIDGLVLDIKRIELEGARRDADYATKFGTKEEIRQANQDNQKISERIFDLLEKMDDKLDTKVNKADCVSCRAGQ